MIGFRPGNPLYRTKSGRVLTDADIEALADEAEIGYDIEHLLARGDNRARTSLRWRTVVLGLALSSGLWLLIAGVVAAIYFTLTWLWP